MDRESENPCTPLPLIPRSLRLGLFAAISFAMVASYRQSLIEYGRLDSLQRSAKHLNALREDAANARADLNDRYSSELAKASAAIAAASADVQEFRDIAITQQDQLNQLAEDNEQLLLLARENDLTIPDELLTSIGE